MIACKTNKNWSHSQKILYLLKLMLNERLENWSVVKYVKYVMHGVMLNSVYCNTVFVVQSHSIL